MLDKKEKIYDLQLTDLGRKQLSQNQLEFVFYAFSDSGVDYSGSIDTVLKTTGTLDDYMFKNFTFEADQRKDHLKDKTLDSWLFTMPTDSPTLPEFRISSTGSITLNKKYKIETMTNLITNDNLKFAFEKNPKVIVGITTKAVVATTKFNSNYTYAQVAQNKIIKK